MWIRRALTRLNEAEFRDLRNAPLGVLVVTRMSSGRCDVYQADIERLMATGGLQGIPIGKFIVDEPGRTRPQIASIDGLDDRQLPITIIYQHGREVEQFFTTHGAHLLRRIAAVTASSLITRSDRALSGGANNERSREHD